MHLKKNRNKAGKCGKFFATKNLKINKVDTQFPDQQNIQKTGKIVR